MPSAQCTYEYCICTTSTWSGTKGYQTVCPCWRGDGSCQHTHLSGPIAVPCPIQLLPPDMDERRSPRSDRTEPCTHSNTQPTDNAKVRFCKSEQVQNSTSAALTIPKTHMAVAFQASQALLQPQTSAMLSLRKSCCTSTKLSQMQVQLFGMHFTAMASKQIVPLLILIHVCPCVLLSSQPCPVCLPA